MVERNIQTIKKMLKKAFENKKTLCTNLPNIIHYKNACNCHVNKNPKHSQELQTNENLCIKFQENQKRKGKIIKNLNESFILSHYQGRYTHKMQNILSN